MDYGLSSIKTALTRPRLAYYELNRHLSKFNQWYHGTVNEDYGEDFMAADWDTLVLLDACRADTFEKVSWLDGHTHSRVTKGTHSVEFMDSNFRGRSLHDTVYVTANPYAVDLPDGTFHDIIPLYESNWNGDHGVVLPADVVEATLDAHDQYPEKRIIAHFMQPHRPYLGEFGEKINNQLRNHHSKFFPHDCSKDDIRQAYEETLEIVLEHVESLLSQITGKTVVSADHGELLGERQRPIPIRGYDHRPSLYVRELTHVPWHVIENGPRRNITSEQPTDSGTDGNIETVEDQLTALGYI